MINSIQSFSGCHFIEEEPYYLETDNEIRMFEVACDARLLIYAAQLIRRGIPGDEACKAAICLRLTDDTKLQETPDDLIDDIF